MIVTAPTRFPRLPVVACGVALCLGAIVDSARDALPPPAPAFKPPAGALFTADFRSGRLTAWHTDRADVWTVTHGMLKAELPDRRQEHSMLYGGDSTWTDYAVDLDVCGMRGVDKGVVVRVNGGRGLGVDLRGPGYQDVRLNLNELPIGRADAENGNGVWQHLRVEVRGMRCRVIVNGVTVFDRHVSNRLPASGGIALAAYTGGVGQCTVYYDNVAVTPLAAHEPKPGKH